jgi:flagellar motor switch protein FliN
LPVVMSLGVAATRSHTHSSTTIRVGGEFNTATLWHEALLGAHPLTDRLNQYTHQFWGKAFTWQLFGLTHRPLAFWKNSIYLTQEVPLSEEATLQLRLSSSAFDPMLASALGERQAGELPVGSATYGDAPSALETIILDRYARHLGQLALEFMVDADALDTQEPDTPTAHLVWLLHPLDRGAATTELPIGKLIVSLPVSAIRKPSPASAAEPTLGRLPAGSYSQWLGQQVMAGHTTVRLVPGATRLTLAELQQLEEDDILLLDQSHEDRLGFELLTTPEDARVKDTGPSPFLPRLMTFPISTVLGRPLPVHELGDDDEDGHGPESLPRSPSRGSGASLSSATSAASASGAFAMSSYSSHPSQASASPYHGGGGGGAGGSLWDHLQIDVHAEFAPTRIPLQQLKQMSEGLVVEVGDLLHNQIQLVANGKPLAQGELVIVGDKFGVLITQMNGPANEGPEPLQLPQAPASAPVAHGPAPSSHEAQALLPQVPGVDQGLVAQAYQLGLDVHQVAEMAQQQGVHPQDAMMQAIAYQQSQMGGGSGSGSLNADEEVARASAMMDEVDRVLNENFDEE